MTKDNEITQEQIEKYYQNLKKDAENGGYNLNPDAGFTKELVSGLITNEQRYGYPSCPCRLSTGIKEKDMDIICPCDYRDPDLEKYDVCFCGLYVSKKIINGTKQPVSIPERRSKQKPGSAGNPALTGVSLPYPVWRCKVCGYLCARENPPETCPVCKVKKDRFERFL